MNPFLIYTFILILKFETIICKYGNEETTDDTLQLVNIFIRHGDRTSNFKYPNDPYINRTYQPYGMGQLNINGKRRMLQVGKELRKRYEHFLGDIYTHDILYALSSDFDRTKMSMQLILTSLFPPNEPYKLDHIPNWQPIPYDYIKFDEDDMLAFWGKCKFFVKNIPDTYFRGPYYQELSNEYSDLFTYLSEHSGSNITSIFEAGILFDVLRSEVEHGLEIPEWAHSAYPEPLRFIYKEQWKAYVEKSEDRKLATGKLFKAITDSFLLKINGTLPLNRKLFLYTGHEYNTSGLLAALNIVHDYKMPYGNHIIFEMHKINEEFVVKVFYQDYSGEEPALKQIGGCTKLCPIEDFIALTKEYFPNPNIC